MTLAWDVTREQWDAIQKKTGEFVGNTVIVGRARRRSATDEHAAEITASSLPIRCRTPRARSPSRSRRSRPAARSRGRRRRSWRSGCSGVEVGASHDRRRARKQNRPASRLSAARQPRAFKPKSAIISFVAGPHRELSGLTELEAGNENNVILWRTAERELTADRGRYRPVATGMRNPMRPRPGLLRAI